jgi:hypothetical protein
MAAFRSLIFLLICLSLTMSAAAQTRTSRRAQKKKPAKNTASVNDKLGVALKAAAATARKHDLSRILVIVREDSRSTDAGDKTATFAEARKRLVEGLKRAGLEPFESNEIERLAALIRPKGLVRPADVRVFRNFAKFDAVIDSVYRQRGVAKALGLTLVTERRRLWSKTVRLPANFGGANKPAGDGSDDGNAVATIPVLNRRVLQFALSQLGKQVGNGECWTLADQAIKRAGARPTVVFNFGRQILLADIKPGDILQFKSVKFQTGNFTYLFGTPDHTAIVLGVQGTKVSILHQNFGKKIVSTLTVDFETKTQGQVWAWRPVGR